MKINDEIAKKQRAIFDSVVNFLLSRFFRACCIIFSFILLLYVLKLIVGESGVVTLVGSLSWPVAIVLIAFVFKDSIEHIAKRLNKISGLGFLVTTHSHETAKSAGKLNVDDTDPAFEEVVSKKDAPEEAGEGECHSNRKDFDLDSKGKKHKDNKRTKFGSDLDENKREDDHHEANEKKSDGKVYISALRAKLKQLEKNKSIYNRSNLLEEWGVLRNEIDNIFSRAFGYEDSDGDFDHQDKMLMLLNNKYISFNQYVTFSKLYEAREFFVSDMPLESIMNYMESIEALLKSLKEIKVVK